MGKLKWELQEVDKDVKGECLFRAEVPGGWLYENRVIMPNGQFSQSICFVPRPPSEPVPEEYIPKKIRNQMKGKNNDSEK